MKRMIVLPMVFASTLAVAQSGGMKGVDMKDMPMKDKAMSGMPLAL